MRFLSRLILCLCGLLASGAPASTARASEPVTVFAAASLTEVLQEIAIEFEEITGAPVRFSFAASSTLARQIQAGAPADVVALASVDWADYLDRRGLLRAGSRIQPIGNRLALVAPADRVPALSEPPTVAELSRALGPHGRLAIGDPAHVPAGIYARQSLETLGLWQVLSDNLAVADNVRAALALVARGEVPLAIVYATDTEAAPGVAVAGMLPESSHAPIAYAFAAVADGDAARAEAFLAFLAGPDGIAIFRRHGFTER